MWNFMLILLIGLSNLPKTTPCVAQYGQCGGLQYTGETDCCAPLTCAYSNPSYSQCISSATKSTTGCSAVYDQCGGQNWSGPTCCDYSTCTYSNPSYSQCLLPASSSSSSSSTTTANSPSSKTTNTPTTSQGSSSTSSSSTTTANSPSSTTTNTPTTSQGSSSTSSSTTTTSTSASSTNQVCSALYHQCGGIGWNGPTCCTESTCTFGNAYYSQCLPSGGSSSSSSSSSSSGGSTVSSITISSGNDNRQPGVTTRYWDCCKASCGWRGKASVTNPVQSCAQNDVALGDFNVQSGCNGGSAYMCSNQQPWSVSSTLSYGYAAAHISGEGESDWCCACYSLIFTSGPVIGKELIVQVTNTGGDLGNNQFDLAMPGGGFGIFDGCLNQFPGPYLWGQQYGGVSQRSDCANITSVLQAGCYWRFDWFMDADNPSMTFEQVTCPSVLTDNTQCIRI